MIHGLQVFRQHAAVVRRKTGFNSRADLSMNGLACSMGATDSCKVGALGSIPIRSTVANGLMVQRKDIALAWRPPFLTNRAGSIPGESTEIYGR